MSVPVNLKNASLKLVEQLLICRPSDAITFSVRYFYDERNSQTSSSPSFSHAIHSLLFLIKKPVQFRSAISTIFCYENSDAKDLRSKSSGGAANTTTPGQSVPVSCNSTKTTKTATANLDDNASVQSSATVGGADPSSRPNTSASESNKKSSSDNIAGLVSDTNDINLADGDKALFSNMNVSDPANNSSKLFQIARSAIQSVIDTTDMPLASSPGASSTSASDVHEWLYAMIERLLNEEIIPQGTYDFDAYIAFIRLYLSLWIVALWVQYCVVHMQSKAYKNGVMFVGIKESAMSSNEDAMTKMLINEKDESNLVQLCSETYNSSVKDEQSNLKGLCAKIMSRYVKRFVMGGSNETSRRQEGNWVVS